MSSAPLILTDGGLALSEPKAVGAQGSTEGGCLVFVSSAVVTVALAAIGRDMRLSPLDLQWVMNAELLPLAAETDRAFADTGHSLDFINKAFECLDLIGWEYASALLPTVVGQMVAARGAEESTAWRQPVDLVLLCETAARELPELFAAGSGRHGWSDHAPLARKLLCDDPAEIIDALKAAIRAGAAPADLGRALAYAAALRLARFGNANEHSDWGTAHHVFTYANAVHQMLNRIGNAKTDDYVTGVRGVLHGVMALYLARYLKCTTGAHSGRRRRAARRFTR